MSTRKAQPSMSLATGWLQSNLVFKLIPPIVINNMFFTKRLKIKNLMINQKREEEGWKYSKLY